MTSRCRSCDAPVRWARTTSGKRMPLDLEPASDGNVQLGLVGGEEIAVVLGAADAAAAQVAGLPLYRSHFSTCPDAGRYRRPTSPRTAVGSRQSGERRSPA